MNSASSSPISKLVNSIQIWDENIYERIYLGWCLSRLDSKLLQEALSFVDEAWFYDENRKTLYTSIVQAALEVSIESGLRIKIERISAAAQLLSSENSKWADRCIENCLEAERQTMFSIESLDAICIAQWRIVKAKPAVEKLILKVDSLLSAKNAVDELPVKVEEALHEASEIWSNSIHQIKKKGEITETQFIDELLEPIDESNPIFAPSSVEAFDSHLLGGVAINANTTIGKLVTIAARPGVGKTATAISILKGISSNGYKGVFYTLEVPKRQMLQRLLCIHDFNHQLQARGQLVNCIKMNQVSKRNFTDDQIDRMNGYRGEISKNIQIYDSFREVRQISSHLKMLKKRDPSIVAACIDHVGLIRLPKNENTSRAIGDITTELKELAVELSMDLLLMCQLNREVEKRNNKRPVLSDLRDSGRIEEDSDTVIGLYRDIDNNSQELEFIALKNRHNGLGTTKCNFYLQYGAVK